MDFFTKISSVERVFCLCIVLLFLVICKSIRCLDFFTSTLADVELCLPFFCAGFLPVYCADVKIIRYLDFLRVRLLVLS